MSEFTSIITAGGDQSGGFSVRIYVRLHLDTSEINMSTLGFFLLPGHAYVWTLDIVVLHLSPTSIGSNSDLLLSSGVT